MNIELPETIRYELVIAANQIVFIAVHRYTMLTKVIRQIYMRIRGFQTMKLSIQSNGTFRNTCILIHPMNILKYSNINLVYKSK